MKKYLLRLFALLLSGAIFIMCIIYGNTMKENTMIYTTGKINSGDIQPHTTFSYTGLNVYNTGKSGYNGDFGIPENANIELKIKIAANKNVTIQFQDTDGNIVIEKTSNKFKYDKILPSKKGNWKFKIISPDIASGEFTFTAVKK